MPDIRARVILEGKGDLSERLAKVEKELAKLNKTSVSTDKNAKKLTKTFKEQDKSLSKLDQGFSKLASKIGGLKNLFTGVVAGAAAVGATLGFMTANAAKLTDQLAKAGVRTGFTADELARLKFGAEQSGSSFEALNNGLRDFNKNVSDAAAGGNKEKFFDILGVDILADGRLKSVQSLFLETADAIAAIPNPADKARISMELFGEGGVQLLPFLQEGSLGIKRLGDEFTGLAGTITPELAAKGEAVADSLNRINTAIQGLNLALLDRFGGSISNVFSNLAGIISRNRGAIDKAIEFFTVAASAAVAIPGGGIIRDIAGLTSAPRGPRIGEFETLGSRLVTPGFTEARRQEAKALALQAERMKELQARLDAWRDSIDANTRAREEESRRASVVTSLQSIDPLVLFQQAKGSPFQELFRNLILEQMGVSRGGEVQDSPVVDLYERLNLVQGKEVVTMDQVIDEISVALQDVPEALRQLLFEDVVRDVERKRVARIGPPPTFQDLAAAQTSINRKFRGLGAETTPIGQVPEGLRRVKDESERLAQTFTVLNGAANDLFVALASNNISLQEFGLSLQRTVASQGAAFLNAGIGNISANLSTPQLFGLSAASLVVSKILGGIFGGDDEEKEQTKQLERIARNTDRSNQLLQQIIGAPSDFVFPSVGSASYSGVGRAFTRDLGR